MAYIQRWERDLSGKGGQYVYDYWPSTEDNDCFFLLAPIVRIVKHVFRLSILKRFIVILWHVIKMIYRVIAFIFIRLLLPVLEYGRRIVGRLLEDMRLKYKRLHYNAFGDTGNDPDTLIR